jgi:hypothetical protein
MLIPKARHCWWTTQVIQHLSSKYQALTSPHYCKKKEKEKKKLFSQLCFAIITEKYYKKSYECHHYYCT